MTNKKAEMEENEGVLEHVGIDANNWADLPDMCGYWNVTFQFRREDDTTYQKYFLNPTIEFIHGAFLLAKTLVASKLKE